MMFNRPNFKEYVMARLVTIAILLFMVFSIFLILVTPNTQDGITPIFLIGLAFSIFIFFIYRGAGRMQKELNTINKYLANLEEIDQIEYKARFFTQEFEDINQNLMQALKKAKKREDITCSQLLHMNFAIPVLLLWDTRKPCRMIQTSLNRCKTSSWVKFITTAIKLKHF